jgi:hypothetical protein
MYIIINKTTFKTTYVEGSFPNLEKDLNEGNDIIVVSLYSNTIKIPYIDHSQNGYGENVWEWKEYRMDLLEIITNQLKNKTLWESIKM